MSSSAEAQDPAQDWEPDYAPCLEGWDVVQIEAGETAPFGGHLFNDEAASCMSVRLDYCPRLANVEMTYLRQQCEANTSALQQTHQAELQALQDQNALLEEELVEALADGDAWYENPGLWFGVGFAGGVITIVVLEAVLPN